MTSIMDIVSKINRLSNSSKILIYIFLKNEITIDETENLIHQNVNNPEYLKKLLDMKKEVAIDTLSNVLPYLNVTNIFAKNVFLKIFPVFLSFSALYEMRTSQMYLILDIIRIHPIFTNDLHIFSQWFLVFDKRRVSRKREFSYKDEFFFQNLPPIDSSPGDDYFSKCIGYSDIALLRAFHRWLRLHRLHKYLYVFSNSTYEQIITIDETNIDEWIASVGISTMTIGAKNKMLRELSELRKRQSALLHVIMKDYQTTTEIEEGIRTIKRVLRTPIKVNDGFNENIPQALVMSLKRVCEVILLDSVQFTEAMIPLFGLLISLLKEAWNYTIFSSTDKDCFNSWRSALSEKINSNYSTKSLVTMSQVGQSDCGLPDLVGISLENLHF